jgi:hypothetical protein
MKKITLLVLLTLISIQFTAQENERNLYPQDFDKKYELKINAFNLIAFASLDFSYEKLINSDSSYGVAVFYNFSDFAEDDIGFPKKFSATPFYRWFFSENKYARGFFVEGFGMLNTYQDYDSNYDSSGFYSSSDIKYQTSFALGISVGGKFVTNGGFTTEVFLGVGRNLIKGESNDDYDYFQNNIVGRFGISLGYRF